MFIEVAGVDGSGKTTVMQLVRRHLLDQGIQTWERSLRSVAKLLFNDLAAEAGHSHWGGVFTANEVEVAHAVEMVAQFRSQILSLNLDRQSFVSDTYVCRWLATAQMWGATNLHHLVTIFGILPPPDVSVRLVVDPATAYRRVQQRPQGDSLLKMSDMSRIKVYADAFEAAAPYFLYPTTLVDANRPLDSVMSEVLELVDKASARTCPIDRLA